MTHVLQYYYGVCLHSSLVQFVGDVAVVSHVNLLETEAVILYPIRGNKFRIVMPALKRVWHF